MLVLKSEDTSVSIEPMSIANLYALFQGIRYILKITKPTVDLLMTQISKTPAIKTKNYKKSRTKNEINVKLQQEQWTTTKSYVIIP